MKTSIYLTLAAAMLTGMAACDKHEEDHEAPTIALMRPLEGAMFKSGDTVRIAGSVGDHSLHELHVMIHNTDSADKVYWEYAPTIHDLEKFDFDQTWIVPVVKDTCDMKVHVKVHDHSENMAEKHMMFRIRPNN